MIFTFFSDLEDVKSSGLMVAHGGIYTICKIVCHIILMVIDGIFDCTKLSHCLKFEKSGDLSKTLISLWEPDIQKMHAISISHKRQRLQGLLLALFPSLYIVLPMRNSFSMSNGQSNSTQISQSPCASPTFRSLSDIFHSWMSQVFISIDIVDCHAKPF